MVYLVLAAQFESFIHPLVIMLTVPLAVAGALFGLWVMGETLNIYSQIGLIMLVGLAAKNGILFGVLATTAFTLFVVPVAYDLLARRTGSPGDVGRQLEREGAAPSAGPDPASKSPDPAE